MATLNLETICDMLRAKGIPAYVEQTGGGCATIYAGESFERTEPMYSWASGEREVIGHGTETRFPALAGPGWFDGPGWTEGRADTADFYIGPDDDGDNAPPFTANDEWTEQTAADAIASVVRGS
jgi:hypothetical protein